MDSPEPSVANPRRFYWLKRLLISFAVFYATIVGLYVWWSRSTTARLDALVVVARADGEPILPQDFTPADVPDSDNAASFLRHAASSIVIPQEIGKEYGAIPGELPLTGREMNLIERVRPAVVAAFPDIERARRAPKIEWGHGFTGWSGAAYGDMDHQRELCWSLMMLALYEHQRGDDSAALARVDDMLFLSRSSEAIDAQVTGHLNASAMGASAAGALLKIAPDLNLRDVTDRKHASGLIEQLLDDSESVDHTARSLLVSRATALSVAGMFGPALPEPLVRSEVARTFEKQRLLAAAARQTDWSRASAMIGPPPRRAGSQLAYMSRLFSQFYWGREDQVVLNCFRWKTDRRAAAIALAIALYRSDHNGAWPDSLQQLVPNYLPAVPLDPMAPDGARFRFIGLRATTQPIIYAVGQDGSDDGGSTRPSRASWDPVDPWTTRDTVYHLTRQPRQIDDSDAAQDHPGDQHDGGGKSK